MINIQEVEHYNKVCSYAKGSYRSWNDAEQKALKEAAPLLKFTLGKSIRQTEDANIKEILAYADLAGASHTVITCNKIQFFLDYDSPLMLVRDYTNNYTIKTTLVEAPQFYSNIETDHSKIVSITTGRYDRFSGILPHDTRRDGLYIRQQDGTHALVRNRKQLVCIYDELGYVSKPGIPPTVVLPSEVSKQDLTKVLEVLNFCSQMGTQSVWSKALAKPLRHSITNYRSVETMNHEQAIKKIIKSSRS